MFKQETIVPIPGRLQTLRTAGNLSGNDSRVVAAFAACSIWAFMTSHQLHLATKKFFSPFKPQ